MAAHQLLAIAFLAVQLNAQQSQAAAEFDIASIKPNKSSSNSSRISSSKGIFRASNISAKALLLNAFDVLPEQISGAPAWIDDDRFDIEAKAEYDPVTGEESSRMQQRLQALLASRFEFKMHRETREWQVYSLVAGKNGPKLTPSEEKGSSTRVGNGHMEAKGITMDSLAYSLAGWLGRPTVNKTGLEGKFNLTLDFEPERSVRVVGGAEPIAGVDVARPSLFTAVQDQLGLKLESRKAPVEMLVVDHIARPTDN